MKQKESVPSAKYKLGSTVRNNILNYKHIVNSIYIEEEVSVSLNKSDCEKQRFYDPHSRHVMGGDFRAIENKKLRMLLTKGPNYRKVIIITMVKDKRKSLAETQSK